MNEAGAMVVGGSTALSQIISQLTPPETEADQKQQSLLDSMASLVGEQGQKAADQLTAEQSANLPQLRQQFADINGQILTKSAEYNALLTENQNKPITMNSIIGNERAILNAKAADIGLLTARAQGLQGQVEVAQETVNRAIDLKYDTIDKQINTYEAQLNALMPTLNKEEKIRAQAQQMLLEERKQELEDTKTEQKNIQNLMLEVAQTGVTDQKVLNRISAAKSYDEAIRIASPILGEKASLERELKLAEFGLDTQYKKAQIANIESEIANRGLSTTEGYDPANILAYAQQYATTGQIPTGLPKNSFGLVSGIAKEIPKPTGTLVNSITGIKDSKLGATEQDDITRLFTITNLANELLELDKKRYGGIIAGSLGKVFGSDAQGQYITKRKAIVDEIQRMQSGAALTEEEQKFYKDYLPGRVSEPFGLGRDSSDVIRDFTNQMNTKLRDKLKINNLAIYGYSKVKIGDKDYTVGDVIESNGQQGIILPDGSIGVQESFSQPPSMGENGSKGNIVSVTIGNKPIQVSSVIANKLAMADRDFYNATGQHLQINEGLRSNERQAQLYANYKSGKGGRAAPPGKSFHETGNAVDIRNWEAAAPYLRKHGFRNELADDRNHFSIGEFS